MAGHLEVPHHLDRDEMPVMEGGRRRIKAAIEGDGAFGKRRAQRVDVGVLGDEPAPLKLVEDVRQGSVPFDLVFDSWKIS